MDKFLETYKLLKLIQEKNPKNLNKPTTRNWSGNLKSSHKGKFWSRQLLWWILATFKEEIIPIIHKVVQKVEEDVILCHISFYKMIIILILKSDKDITRNLNTNIPHKYMDAQNIIKNNNFSTKYYN